MQLRHIRPGSLEWQESKTEEADQRNERLTPEEIRRLRSMSDDRRQVASEETSQPVKL